MTFQRRICPFSGRISTLSSVGIPDLQNPKIADRSYAHHSRGKLERREGEFVNGTYPSVIFKDGAGKEDRLFVQWVTGVLPAALPCGLVESFS